MIFNYSSCLSTVIFIQNSNEVNLINIYFENIIGIENIVI